MIRSSEQPTWLSFFPSLQSLEADAMQLVATGAQRLNIAKGTSVFNEGSQCLNYVFVLDGAIRVQKVSENGREIVLYRVETGDTCILTTSCLMNGEDYAAEGICETDVDAVVIPSVLFHRLLAVSAVFRSFVFSVFGTRISNLLMLIEEVAFRRIDTRLADFLVEHSGVGKSLTRTHQEIAVELGSAREVISRQLKEFERRGWVKLSRGKVEVLNLDPLRELAKANA